MATFDLSPTLAVCSWSLQADTPEQLVDRLDAIGIPRVQLALDPLREHPGTWERGLALLARRGYAVVSGMFGTVGEDYSTLDSIRQTGGVVPDPHWDANWRNIQATAERAAALGLKFVSFHAGFLPHSPSDPSFAKLMGRIAQIADLFAARGIALGFETGQETADTLAAFLRQLARSNVGVNFDPANMILYDKGDPIAALRTLSPWLRQCHIKDARRTRTPGTWGEEVATGTGEVDWPAFFRVLKELDFRGPLCIEREAGQQRVEDIRSARRHIEAVAAAL